MSTIILCDKAKREKVSNNTIFIPSKSDLVSELEKYDDLSATKIVFKQCGFYRLFNGTTPHSQLWNQFHRVLKNNGILIIEYASKSFRSTLQSADFSVVIQNLNARFLLISSDGENLTFRKIVTLEPTIVTPEEINEALARKTRVESLFQFNGKKQICDVMKSEDRDKLGAGRYGSVYFYPKWKSDVVVKIITGMFPVFKDSQYSVEAAIGEDGTRKTSDFLEVFSSSMLQELLTGESKFGHSVHIPRFEGFFSCIDENEVSLYMIEEKLGNVLKHWIRKEVRSYNNLKCVIWQCLYILVFLNKLGWSHGDASTENFLVTKIDDEYYHNHTNIGDAKEWTYRLDDREWKLKNTKWLCKISDFGFMQHFEPIKNMMFPNYISENFRIPGKKVEPGADIGYFMITLGGELLMRNTKVFENVRPLFMDWFKLLGLKIDTDMYNHKLFLDRDASLFMLDTYRLKPTLEQINVSALLDSSYFDDVISH
jgi:hypothetical protein